MTLGERIRMHRKKSGMSQEKVAELVGVSRQAVAKWESGQSAPNTDNLFKLADVFGTKVDFLLEDGESRTFAEQIYALHKSEQEQRYTARRTAMKRNVSAAMLTAAGYLAVYLLGRLLWCDRMNSSVMGWLLFVKPQGAHSYLYGWLLSSNLFWWAAAISVLPALVGKWKFSAVTFSGFLIGLVSGILFGPYPPGIPYGHGHYGWAIWGGCFLVSIVLGIFMEAWSTKQKNSGSD